MKQKLKSITIEHEDGSLQTLELNMDNAEYTVEYGLAIYKHPNLHDPYIESNGIQRILIKASKGCADYNSFRTDAGERK